MIRMASVYERGGKLYFSPTSRTVTGLWILTPPIVDLELTAKNADKGDALLRMLNASTTEVPNPAPGTSAAAPLLTAANVASWSDFIRQARGIKIELHNGRLKFIPYKKVDDMGRHVSIPEHVIELREGSPNVEIGSAIEASLSRCQ